MELTFMPNGIVQIDNARIIYRNFAGVGSKFNRDGDRNFAVIIEDKDLRDALINDVNKYGVGWNVKTKPPRDEDEAPFMTLMVKIKFNDRGPNVYLKSGDNMIRLDEDSIECLDNVDIASVDLDIKPYDDEINGKPFRAAYLQSMCVTQNITDRFASRYEEN